MAKRDHRKGGLPYPFVAFPRSILCSEEWLSLPHSARCLAFDLAAQYTGKNNGRLTPAFEVMRRSGWTSKDTLMRAKKALLNCSFVCLTRKGHAPRTAEWIGFTWWELNWDRSMDIGPKGLAYLNFMSIEAARIDPNAGRENAVRSKQFARSGIRTDGASATPLRPPESVPIAVGELASLVRIPYHTA